jgi:hypothetical protein
VALLALGVVREATGAVLPGVMVEAASPVLIEKVRTTRLRRVSLSKDAA